MRYQYQLDTEDFRRRYGPRDYPRRPQQPHLCFEHDLERKKKYLLEQLQVRPGDLELLTQLQLLDIRIMYAFYEYQEPPLYWLHNHIAALRSLVPQLLAKIDELQTPPSDYPWWQQLWYDTMEGADVEIGVVRR
jgi:hypothetical protein